MSQINYKSKTCEKEANTVDAVLKPFQKFSSWPTWLLKRMALFHCLPLLFILCCIVSQREQFNVGEFWFFDHRGWNFKKLQHKKFKAIKKSEISCCIQKINLLYEFVSKIGLTF